MAAPEGRQPLYLWLSPDARDGLRRFCKRRDVSMSAFVEALGLALRETSSPRVSVLVAAAREIDAERRSRKAT